MFYLKKAVLNSSFNAPTTQSNAAHEYHRSKTKFFVYPFIVLTQSQQEPSRSLDINVIFISDINIMSAVQSSLHSSLSKGCLEDFLRILFIDEDN